MRIGIVGDEDRENKKIAMGRGEIRGYYYRVCWS